MFCLTNSDREQLGMEDSQPNWLHVSDVSNLSNMSDLSNLSNLSNLSDLSDLSDLSECPPLWDDSGRQAT